MTILLLLGAIALSGCASAGSSGEPGGVEAAREANAGPLGGVVAKLEAEDDAAEDRERAEAEAPSPEEHAEALEEEHQAEAQHQEAEERAIEEEAHVGASEEASAS